MPSDKPLTRNITVSYDDYPNAIVIRISDAADLTVEEAIALLAKIWGDQKSTAA